MCEAVRFSVHFSSFVFVDSKDNVLFNFWKFAYDVASNGKLANGRFKLNCNEEEMVRVPFFSLGDARQTIILLTVRLFSLKVENYSLVSVQ